MDRKVSYPIPLRSRMAALTLTGLLLPSLLSADPPAHSTWAPLPAATDEFNGNALDRGKWLDTHPNWAGRSPSYFYPPNVSVRDGRLSIRATPDPGSGDPQNGGRVRAACLSSLDRQLHQGYYEASIKASDLSMTTAFWMKGKVSEIDVIENIGRPSLASRLYNEWNMKMNTHYLPNGPSTDITTPKDHRMPIKARDTFHVYGVEWNETWIRFFLNGTEVFNVKQDGRFSEGQTLFFDTETFAWEGLPTLTSLQDSTRNFFQVDWVRAWKRTGGATSILIRPPSVGRRLPQAGGDWRNVLGARIVANPSSGSVPAPLPLHRH